MNKRAFLALEDGSVYEGLSLGADGTTYGEVVFNTSMYGYQEMLTDPSYAGQILLLTYPNIGNYGINESDFESKQIQVRGLIVREHCVTPSHNQSKSNINEYLSANGIPGLFDIDTRMLTRRLRFAGVMMGILTNEMNPEDALEELKRLPRYDSVEFAHSVSTAETYDWKAVKSAHSPLIVVVDYGLKRNILRGLDNAGCRAKVVPINTTADEILSLNPDGILLSPGPGDPACLADIQGTVKQLIGKKPIMGICLGHQLIARALGAETYKLKFGHRGGNHPVREIATNQIRITSQNHGYAVDADSLKGGLEVSHINLNDGTVEGLTHRELPVFSIQYHAEGAPGPMDNLYMFDRFLKVVIDS
jgi:carbamoyl-phosphate synthase small subunit